MMNRKEKLAIRQHQSTRQLMGIQRITPHGVTTARGELVFFLIRPDNLTVLSEDGIRVRVTALANLLRAESAVELLALDSRESFQRNKEFYQARLEQETIPPTFRATDSATSIRDLSRMPSPREMSMRASLMSSPDSVTVSSNIISLLRPPLNCQ